MFSHDLAVTELVFSFLGEGGWGGGGGGGGVRFAEFLSPLQLSGRKFEEYFCPERYRLGFCRKNYPYIKSKCR